MSYRIGLCCLILTLLAFGCATGGSAPTPTTASGKPWAAPRATAAPEPATELGPVGEALMPDEGAYSEGFEDEPLVSEELPEANPDEVLASDSEEADRLKKQARQIEEEIKEEVSFDIPIVLNQRVAYFLDYFQTDAREHFSTWLGRSTAYLPRMQAIFREQGLPEDLAYLALIESGFNPRAMSRSRAVGPWQFIRGTGRRYGLSRNWWLDERRDFEKSTYAAAAYLTDLYQEFGSWYLAAAAYNCGEGRIRRAIRRYKTEDYWEICDHRAVSRETRDYVPKMIAAMLIAKEPEKHGFTDICYEEPLEFDVVELDRATDLALIAELCSTDYQHLKELNPELRRTWTPPVDDGSPYRLRVPVGTKDQLLASLAERKDRAVSFVQHRVRSGDTLWEISRTHGCPLQVLEAANNINNSRHLRIGQVLIIPIGMGKSQARTFARTNTPPPRSAPAVYTVRRGDSLYTIAQRYGTTVAHLRRLNPGVDDLLHPGQKLAMRGEPRPQARAARQTRHSASRDVFYSPRVHTVRRGDSLYRIARRYGTTVGTLRKLNPGISNLLHPGQKVVVGKTRRALAGDEATGKRVVRTYRVKPGDSLWKIARRYNVGVNELRSWNGLRKGEHIYPGDRLKLMMASEQLGG